jgi:signal transduction histidine kinase
MKLLKKTTYYYFIFSIITFFILVIAFYSIAEYLIYRDVDNRLNSERKYFEEYMYHNHGVWYYGCYFVDNKVEVKTVSTWKNEATFKDTLLFDRQSNEKIPFREVTFYMKFHKDIYQVNIRKSLIESRLLIEYITVIMISLMGLLFLIMYFVQQRIAAGIWKPFYFTLNTLQEFKLNNQKKIEWKDGNIDEFTELNGVLDHMIDKMRSDYKNLKEFTENASHELQTPVSVISVRAEELIQSENLTERQQYLIKEIYQSCTKMSKLSQALLLLSKIENRQFSDVSTISFDELIQKKIKEYEELFQLKALKVFYVNHGDFTCIMNTLLADILLSNLIINATKHNFQDGTIAIDLNSNQLIIKNTGDEINTHPDNLFNRFSKGKQRPDSSGLGLAIVKQIIETYTLTITYSYNQSMHIITISRE